MSNEAEKARVSKRRLKDENAVKRQLKIAKAYNHTKYVKEPHRLAKHHAMDCGTPGCVLCGNPRNNKLLKTKDKLTIQERKFFQDLDNAKRNTGLNPDDQETD